MEDEDKNLQDTHHNQSACGTAFKWPATYHLLLIPPLIILIYLSFFPITRAYLALQFPYQLDSEEGFLLYQSMLLSQGKSIYPDVNAGPPYIVGNYPPVYPLTCVPFLLFGKTLFGPRVVNILAGLGILVFMFLIVWDQTRHVLFALLSPLLLTVSYCFYEWLGYARVDLLALFFSVAGLWAFLKSESMRWRALSLLLFILAFYTKQTRLIAYAACALFLLLSQPRAGGKYIGIFLGISFLIFILLQILTRGRFFLHTVVYNVNIMDWWQFKQWLIHMWRFYTFLIVAAAILVIWTLAFLLRHRTFSSTHVLELYFFLALLSLVTIAKKGAAANYILEPLTAAALLFSTRSGALASSLKKSLKMRRVYIISLTLIGLLWLHTGNLLLKKGWLFSRPNPASIDYYNGMTALDYVNDAQGEVYVEYPIFAITARKNVWMQPFIMSQLAREGKWNQNLIVREFENKTFSLIMTTQDVLNPDQFFYRYTPEMLDAIRDGYQPLFPSSSPDKTLASGPAAHYYLYIPLDEEGDT